MREIASRPAETRLTLDPSILKLIEPIVTAVGKPAIDAEHVKLLTAALEKLAAAEAPAKTAVQAPRGGGRSGTPNDNKGRYANPDEGAGGKSQKEIVRQTILDAAEREGGFLNRNARNPSHLTVEDILTRLREAGVQNPVSSGNLKDRWIAAMKDISDATGRPVADVRGGGTAQEYKDAFARNMHPSSKTLSVPAAIGAGASAAAMAGGSDEVRAEEHPVHGHTIYRHGPTGQYASKPDERMVPDDEGRKHGGSVNITPALHLAHAYANGGQVHVGPVVGATDGRADERPISVPGGAFVIPADVVSALGSGNTMAGMGRLQERFGSQHGTRRAAAGGAVPIRISDGEFVVAPDVVEKIGNGDVGRGHKILDAMVVKLRRNHIKALGKLPPPSK